MNCETFRVSYPQKLEVNFRDSKTGWEYDEFGFAISVAWWHQFGSGALLMAHAFWFCSCCVPLLRSWSFTLRWVLKREDIETPFISTLGPRETMQHPQIGSENVCQLSFFSCILDAGEGQTWPIAMATEDSVGTAVRSNQK